VLCEEATMLIPSPASLLRCFAASQAEEVPAFNCKICSKPLPSIFKYYLFLIIVAAASQAEI
jgi:hypothetical protein